MTETLRFYEELKKHIHEEAARMIAEALPLSERLATSSDIQDLRAEIQGLRAHMETHRTATAADIESLRLSTAAEHEKLRGDLRGMEASIYRWMLTFFATLWLGMAGMIITIVLKL